MDGGKKYGEGVYGVTYDFACKLNDNETLCKMLKEKRVASIQLHSFNSEITLEKPNELMDFVRYIHDLDCCVAKVFKGYMIGFDKKGFTEELDGMKTIYKIFGKETERETTLTSMKMYGFNFEAVYIVLLDGSHIYVTFSRKCESTLEKTPMNTKMLYMLAKNLLSTLEKMQDHNFAHCDIKPDNIIYCKRIRRFKFIDWGLSNYIRKGNRLAGTVMFGCPLAHYVSGYPGFVAARLMYMSVWKRDNAWFNSPVFQELYKVISEDFTQVLEEGGNLLKKYGKKFDVFAVGMCLGWVVWKHGLKWHKHRKFILDMVSMKGFPDARSALAVVR
jgi:serine/threonine protein kinase